MAPHMVSRWAPASEPPTMARGSCHTSARSAQSSSDSPMGGRSPVRSPSATTTSSSASKGSTPRACATSPTLRPFGVRVLRGERLVDDQALPHGQMPQNAGLVGLRAGVEATAGRGVRQRRHALRRPGARRPRATPAGRRGWPRARSSAAAAWCGAASAPPRSRRAAAAALPAASWLQAPSGFMAETPSTFQLTGRSASSDMVARKSMSSSLNPLRQPATMSSTVVPSCWRTAAARRSISSRAAAREGTGWPSPSLWVWTCEVEKPSAPSSSAACSAASMASMSPRVGRAPDGALPHDEPAQRRVADQEPGVHGDAAVEPARSTRRRSPSPRARPPAARPGACPRPAPSSARCSRRAPAPSAPARSRSCRRARWSRRAAATGWRWGPRRAARRSACAGRRSPASTSMPVASITVSARAPSPAPSARRRRSARPSISTSARTGGAPVPSTTVPPRMATVMSLLLACCPRVPGPDARGPAGGRRPACPRCRAPRPKPDCFHPPIGAYMSMADRPWALTKTVPADSRDGHVGRQRVVVAPDRRAQAEGRVVGRRDRLVDVVVGDHGQGRARTAPRARCRVSAGGATDERRRDEVAPRCPRPRGAAAPGAPARRPPRRPRRARPRPGRARRPCAPGPWSRRRPGRRPPSRSPAGPPARPPSRPTGPGARRAA